jgi:hypothetical protein
MATYTRTYTSGNDYIAPSQGYSVYVIDGGAGTDTFYADVRSTGFTISPMDSNGVTTVSGASGTTLKLTNVEKIAFKDGQVFTLETIVAAPVAVTGTAANDLLSGTSANNSFDGGTGIDTLVISNVPFSSVTLAKNGGTWSISSTATGSDTLINIERIQFSDKKIALDVSASGNAGEAIQFIGTVASGLKSNSSVVGTILSVADQTDLKGIFQLALDLGLISQLAGGSNNLDIAKLAYQNIVGMPADSTTASLLASHMDNGMSQVDFLTTVAGFVDLTGIQSTGVEYI